MRLGTCAKHLRQTKPSVRIKKLLPTDKVEMGEHDTRILTEYCLKMNPMTPLFRTLIWGILCVGAGTLSAQEDRLKYIESNWGIAFIDDFELPFPGTSFLVGRQSSKGRAYWEIQGGLAFPSTWTAKVGAGVRSEQGPHFSTGVRIFPLHAYLQAGFPTKRCQREVSKAKLRRLAKRGKTTANILCTEWVFSAEASPATFTGGENSFSIGEGFPISMYSTGLLTVGKRWFFD